MAQVLTIEEIRSHYTDEWLLIANAELDEAMNVLRGEVLAHSPDRDEIYHKLLSVKGKSIAIEYTGAIPDDLAVIL